MHGLTAPSPRPAEYRTDSQGIVKSLEHKRHNIETSHRDIPASEDGIDPRLKHPFACLVAGPTGCGKTTFVKELIEKAQMLIDPPPQRIVWCYGEWQSGYQNIEAEFVEGLYTAFDPSIPNLVVIDDMMGESEKQIAELFTRKSHHCNLSVVYIVQNIFQKSKESRTISLNTHYMVVFKNPRDSTQITHLAKQMYPHNIKYVQEAFEDGTSKPFGYLFIDLKQETSEYMRLRSEVLSPVKQTVYFQKT